MKGINIKHSLFAALKDQIDQSKTLSHELIAFIREELATIIQNQDQQIVLNSLLNDLTKYGKVATPIEWKDYTLDKLSIFFLKVDSAEGEEYFKDKISSNGKSILNNQK